MLDFHPKTERPFQTRAAVEEKSDAARPGRTPPARQVERAMPPQKTVAVRLAEEPGEVGEVAQDAVAPALVAVVAAVLPERE